MRRKYFYILILFLIPLQFVLGQVNNEAFDKELDKAKFILKTLEPGDMASCIDAGKILEKLTSEQPENAEAWYFYGYAIDKYNSGEGETLLKADLGLAIRASEAYKNSIELSENHHYEGEKILFDPHTKILNIWGTQALRYLSLNNKDSADWCLNQAAQHGGVNKVVLEFYRQELTECSNGSYLFTNGDLSLYYLAYLQRIEGFRKDLIIADLNYLNTSWYLPLLVKSRGLNDSIAKSLTPTENKIKWTAQDVKISIAKANDSAMIDSSITWTVKPSFGNNLIRSDQILLNFLKYNQFQKEIFFAADVPASMRLSLSVENYLQLRGLTLKMVKDTASSNMNFLESRLAILPSLPVDNNSYLDNPDNVQVLNNYRFAYTAAAVIASLKNNSAESLRLIYLAERKYPELALPFFATETKEWFAKLKENAELEKPLIW